jgi:hypothetical protein
MGDLPVWIHVGLAKTGTTSLQRCVFSQHPEILYLGKEIDKDYVISHPLYHIARSPTRKFDVDATRAGFSKLIDNGLRAGSGKRICVLSEEGLTGYRALNPAICASRAHKLFPDASILLVLREPLDWLKSMYFFRLSLRFPETLDGFNDWLRASLARVEVGTDIGVLRIGTIARTWASLFGEGRLKVMLYEDFRADAATFIAEMCESMGVDAQNAVHLYNANNKFAKTRISKRQQEFCTSFRLVRDGNYAEYLNAVSPLLRVASKKDRATAESLLPANMSAGKRDIEQQLLIFSRFVDRAARPFLRSGEQASVELDGELRGHVGRMVEPGLQYIAATFGVRTQHYIDSLFSRPL